MNFRKSKTGIRRLRVLEELDKSFEDEVHVNNLMFLYNSNHIDARSHDLRSLCERGLIEKTRIGFYRITAAGRKYLSEE